MNPTPTAQSRVIFKSISYLSHSPVKIVQMPSIKPYPLPENALLNKYVELGAYTDCYTTDVPGNVSHAQYVKAFYTTRLFKLERLILKWAVSKPSSDDQAIRLANGETDSFAAWSVEGRCEDQLLLCDFAGRTRSWLMVESFDSEESKKTRLYFGSAVTRRPDSGRGRDSFGFSVLVRFHKTYSVLLLYAASLSLKNMNTRASSFL